MLHYNTSMLLKYIGNIRVIEVGNTELWFNTSDIGLILKCPASLVLPKNKNKRSLLKEGKTDLYINEAAFLTLFNYDQELFLAVKKYHNYKKLPCVTIKSTAEKILRMGLIYRALCLGPNNFLEIITAGNKTKLVKDPYGLILPKESFSIFIKEVVEYFLRYSVIEQNITHILKERYGQYLIGLDDLNYFYFNGFNAEFFEQFKIVWNNVSDWDTEIKNVLALSDVKQEHFLMLKDEKIKIRFDLALKPSIGIPV